MNLVRITAAAAYKDAKIVTCMWDQLYTNRAFVTFHTASILFIFKIINCKLEICTSIMCLYHNCGFVYFSYNFQNSDFILTHHVCYKDRTQMKLPCNQLQ